MSEPNNAPVRPAFSRLPDDEIKQGQEKHKKTVFWLKMFAILFAIIFGLWFNFFRSVPLRISKETTYITKPLTPDGRVDYFAALQLAFHPPEMKTDENGYRVVFRALGDLSGETCDFVALQNRYKELGLDATLDKPTMTYIEPSEYFNQRFKLHPEEFKETIAAEKERWLREQEDIRRNEIADVKGDPDLTDEDKAVSIKGYEEEIKELRLTLEERKAKWIEKIQNDPDMTDEEKAKEIARMQSPDESEGMMGMGSFMGSGWVPEFSYDPDMAFLSLTESRQLHKDAIMRKWLEENNAALDLVAEQVKKPVFVMPYFASNSSGQQLLFTLFFPDVQTIARGLNARAQIRLGDGDIDGAIDDILACYRLGRHVEKQATLVEALISFSIEWNAVSLPYDTNAETRASAEQLKRLQDGIAQLSPQKGFLHKMEYGRYFTLDALQYVMRSGVSISDFLSSSRRPFSGRTGSPFDIRSLIGLDWNYVFKKVNRTYDELIAGTYTYVTPSMSPARLLTLKSRSDALADIVIDLFLPEMVRAKEFYRRSECTMNLRRIVLAMHLYEREHGTLPPAFSVDENGKPLHSWRTLLLPYFGDETLTKLASQIRLDEPWDSEHNRQFHKQNINVYRCPSATNNDGDSNYAVITGDELLFTTDGKGQPFAKCGLNMLLLAERRNGVCWMRPDAEIIYTDVANGDSCIFRDFVGRSPGTPVSISGHHNSGGCNFGLRDGSVMFISNTIDKYKFRDLVRGTAKEMPH